jgi:cell division protein FtsL
MEQFSQMQIFFLISSVGFVIVFILASIFLFYLITTIYSLRRIIFKIEKGIDRIGDTTKDLLEDMRDNIIFKFIFGRKKRRKD